MSEPGKFINTHGRRCQHIELDVFEFHISKIINININYGYGYKYEEGCQSIANTRESKIGNAGNSLSHTF